MSIAQNDQSINVIDLFCGAGGLSYGFERAQYRVLLGIDNDQRALDTFKLNHKGSKIICGDISEITGRDIVDKIGTENIDVIVGGPPCQGMSLSGPRKFNDPRNVLYLSFIRLVAEIQPKAFVIENVPGLVGLFGGEIKNNIIREFEKIQYSVKFSILDASNYGVPQRRRRVFFVGIKGKNHFEFPVGTGEIITCEMALSDLPPLHDSLGTIEQDYYTEPQNQYQVLMRTSSSKIHNHIAANHTDRVKQIISLVPDGGNYKDLPDELRNTRNFNVAWTRFSRNSPSPTIDTGHRHHFHYEHNRVPTVRECARLQSFPDDFIFLGNKTEQFRQVGNAVPPLLAEEIANELRHSLIEGGINCV